MAVDTLVGAGTGGYDTDGHVNESVLQTIFDLSKRPLEFQDMIGRGTHGREKHEWTMRRLAKGSHNNARVDGSDPTADDNKIGVRVSNHSQICAKTVKVSDRVRASDAVGVGDELRRQVTDRAWEMRYDMESSMLSNNASVADDGSSTAGKSAGLVAWAKAEDVDGTASLHFINIGTGGSYADGGFNTSTQVVDKTTFATTNTALAQSDIDDVIEVAWGLNATPSVAFCGGAVMRRFSDFMFTSSAKISTLVNQGSDSDMERVAQGSVNVYQTNYGTRLQFVASPHMPTAAGAAGQDMTDGTTDTDVLLFIKPDMFELSTLMSFRTETHAKTGMATEMEHKVDWTLVVKNHEALQGIVGIDSSAAMTAT